MWGAATGIPLRSIALETDSGVTLDLELTPFDVGWQTPNSHDIHLGAVPALPAYESDASGPLSVGEVEE